MKIQILAALVVTLWNVVALANTIGPAGCGWGNQFFHKDNQIMAATTNDLFGTQTFGISSGTSGCEQDRGMAKLQTFVDGNRLALANDAARGYGETVVGLTKVLHCQDAEEVGHVLKENYSRVFPSSRATSADISERVQSVLRSHNVACIRAS